VVVTQTRREKLIRRILDEYNAVKTISEAIRAEVPHTSSQKKQPVHGETRSSLSALLVSLRRVCCHIEKRWQLRGSMALMRKSPESHTQAQAFTDSRSSGCAHARAQGCSMSERGNMFYLARPRFPFIHTYE